MKQVVQNYKTGELKLLDIPFPVCRDNTVLVKNVSSLVSIGTEKSVINIGKKGLLGKAMARPEHVKRLIEKMKNEGVVSSVKQALNRLDTPTPLGYSSAGVIVEIGKNIKRFKIGDRVACIGQGFASHAEVVVVPELMCCNLPDEVDFESGAFGMLGVIAMHGVRTAKLHFGENVGVMGLGLLGLLTVQMLKSYGCNVIATDLDPKKLDLARKVGIENVFLGSEFSDNALKICDGIGLDAVILTLSTDSSKPLDLAIEISRSGGRIVLVGVADIHPNRNEMWKKEVEIVVSKVAGPGSLEDEYEVECVDYPFSHVRWTQGRNLKEFVRLLKKDMVKCKPLITHRYPHVEAERAYSEIFSDAGASHVGIVFTYPDEMPKKMPIITPFGNSKTLKNANQVNIGIIGAGLFGRSVLIPKLKKNKKANILSIATSNGINAENVARRFGISEISTDFDSIIENPDIQSVVILTPHSAHAKMVCSALEASKNVFVEKPLCISREELNEIVEQNNKSSKILMVGYNRRYSKIAQSLKQHFGARQEPLVMHYRVNAGYIMPSHWVHKPEEGGSRVVGEICHFVDFMQFLSGSMVEKVYGEMVGSANSSVVLKDNLVISLKLSDGSVGSITYSAAGDRACPRERVEVCCERKTAILEDYRVLTLYEKGGKKVIKLTSQDMGYSNELSDFINSVLGNQRPEITSDEFFNSTEAVFAIDESLSKGTPRTVLMR